MGIPDYVLQNKIVTEIYYIWEQNGIEWRGMVYCASNKINNYAHKTPQMRK